MKTGTKRWISAGLVAVLVIAALQFLPDTLPNTSHAEGEIDFTVSGDVVRGVLDDISELSIKYNYDKSAPRGTVTHPFIVLEIVPYLEYAEFGYLVGGCEPIAIETLAPKTMSNVYGTIGTMNTSDVYAFNGTLYFFDDEPEYAEWLSKKGVGTYNINESTTWVPNGGVYGYYELVEEGGNFLYTAPPIDTASGGDQGQTASVSTQGQEQSESDSTQEELAEEDQGDIPYTASIYTASDGDQEPIASVSTQSEDNDNMPISPIVGDVLLEATIEKVAPGTGNMVWHSANEINIYYHQYQSDQQTMAEFYHLYEGVTFEDDYETAIKESRLSVVGEKLYTKRPVDWSLPPVMSVSDSSNVLFAVYKNRENFLRYSVIPDYQSEEEIDNYSVLIKTITPAELNETPGWIDYADLISISPQQHSGGENYRVYWDEYNRLGKSRTNTTGNYVENFEDNRDISWEVALELYNKVTADTDFAALVMDSTTWKDPNGNNIPPALRKEVTVDVYDFNLNKKSTQPNTLNIEGSANNVFKLACMLICMDPYFFKQIYLNGENPILQTGEIELPDGSKKITGKITLQESGTDPNAAYYWLPESFLLAPNDADVKPIGKEDSLQAYWDKTMWDTYGFCSYSYALADYPSKNWCKGHVYAYKGDHALSMGYTDMSINTVLERFTDFAGSLKEGDGPYTKEAIQYVLGIRSNPNDPTYGRNTEFRILDLEPSVDLYADGSPNYYLKPTYFTMLLPNFRGSINVTHQTTAEFIGKIEDLNTTYQMIYMGLDFSAYNTGYHSGANAILPVWNDGKNGLIYRHTGDSVISTEQQWGNPARDRSVKWLLQDDGSTLNSDELRFPGNDISYLKKQDLQNFIDAGYPVIADAFLFNLDPVRIEKNSYVYQLIDNNRYVRSNLFSTGSSVNDIEDAIRNVLQDAVVFNRDLLPKEYNGRTDSTVVPESTANYLASNKLEFSFTVYPTYVCADSDCGRVEVVREINGAAPENCSKCGSNKFKQYSYRYNIYVDSDRDSKFLEGPVWGDDRNANVGVNTTEYTFSSTWLGMIQWKIEVYQVDESGNPTGMRYSANGHSAVKNKGEKKLINVLQITPDKYNPDVDPFGGNLSLDSATGNERFTKYYDSLQDYKIHVDTMTWSEFEQYFYTGSKKDGTAVTKGFYYDYSKPISDGPNAPNPGNLGELSEELLDYNMIIVGFGDTFGGTNLSNEFGAVDYIRYFVDQGKSILFTHDLTSMLNQGKNDYGYTVNALMRDLMGMNRYGAVSDKADGARNKSNPTLESAMLRTYQKANASKYDSFNSKDFHDGIYFDSSATHGYTYYALKRLGFIGYFGTQKGKIPYKYMIYKPADGTDYVSADDNRRDFNGYGTGFANTNDVTTQVTMTNQGQVTTYPYYIGNNLTVANTHAQWYSLSPEDPNVTVWYTLAGDPSNINVRDGNNGISTTYAVSPDDAMNNYYIYSKNNIFYSGVGHSVIDSEIETKLFINTIIAAYNAGAVPPTIEVTNEEAFTKGILRYAIELLQSYDFVFDEHGELQQTVEGFGGSNDDTYPVYFTPVDMNFSAPELESKIWYKLGPGDEDIVYVDSVVELKSENGKLVPVRTVSANSTTHIYSGDNALKAGTYYRLDYPMSNMSKPKHDTYFWIKNPAKKNMENTTILEMDVLPLFPLD